MSSWLNGYILVAAAFLIFVVNVGIQSAFGVFFTPMLTDFGWTKALTSGASSISWVISGLLGITMGRLSDRYGSRWVVTISGVLIGLGYFLLSQISDIWQFFLLYLVIGVGMAGIWVPIVSTIARCFHRKRSKMTAIVLAGGGIGSLIAPPIANWLISIYDWRTSYIILGTVTLVIIVSGAQFLRIGILKTAPRADKQGDSAQPTLISTGITLPEATREGQFWMQLFFMFCMGFCAYAITVHIVPYSLELGISPTVAANILAVVGGAAIFGRMAFGFSANHIGTRQVFIFGFILISASSFWLLSINSTWQLFAFAALFGFGFGSGVAHSPMVAELYGLRSNGIILGAINIGYCAGSALGPFAAGWLFDVTGNYTTPFIVCAAMGILGLVLTSLIKVKKKWRN